MVVDLNPQRSVTSFHDAVGAVGDIDQPLRRIRRLGGEPRGIGEDNLGDGAMIVGAARVVEEIVNGARTVAFA